MPARWSVAVFAYNEAHRIAEALTSIEAAAAGEPIAISVLVNGCTDGTGDAVRRFADGRPHIRLIEIARADKANAWNTYVHEAVAADAGSGTAVHFFVDGDVRVEPGALRALATALDQVPTANAAGGMPTTGRDREGWRARMVARGMLAGNLYALRGSFVARLRAGRVRLPVGFIGEDWLVSYLAGTDLDARASHADPLVVFVPDGGFTFRSLSRLRLRDYVVYSRRLWRYALREVQFEMLLRLVGTHSIAAMPADVDALYRAGLPPSRLKWAGRRTLLRALAVQHVRSLRARPPGR